MHRDTANINDPSNITFVKYVQFIPLSKYSENFLLSLTSLYVLYRILKFLGFRLCHAERASEFRTRDFNLGIFEIPIMQHLVN